jgi:hypothetical protein
MLELGETNGRKSRKGRMKLKICEPQQEALILTLALYVETILWLLVSLEGIIGNGLTLGVC